MIRLDWFHNNLREEHVAAVCSEVETGEWVLPDTVRAVSAIWFPDHLIKLVLKHIHVNESFKTAYKKAH